MRGSRLSCPELAELKTYVPPAPVDGLAVGGGTLVACLITAVVAVGFGVAVFFFLVGVSVGTGGIDVAVGGIGVAVAVGVIVGVGEGGPGGGGIVVGTNVGGGGGVLAAANVGSDELCSELLIKIRPTTIGTASTMDKRLFMQDSLRVQVCVRVACVPK